MKNTIFYSIFLSVALLCGNAQALDLPKADLSSPILKTIDARKSTRNFSSKPVSEQLLSNILWAAFGTNTHNTRTIPTAMNQQKFYLNYADGKITASAGRGFYTKIDLGIVKYHFELGAGKDNFRWG